MVGKILVVDDEDTLRLTIKTRLAAGGFETDAAVDGEEALEKLKQTQFDVVLLDINMPRMDGITALGNITELYPKTDVIMLTGFADFTTAIECLKKGARDYLVKPIDTTELITRLRSLLRARTSEAALDSERKKQASFVFDEILDPMIVLHDILAAMSKGSFGKTTKEQAQILGGLVDTAAAIIDAGKNSINPSLLTQDSVRVEMKDVAAEKIFDSLVEQAAVLAGTSGLEVKMKVEPKLGKLQADAAVLKHGLESAIAAAVSVASKGSTIAVTVSRKPDVAGFVGAEAVVVEIHATKIGEKAQKTVDLASRSLESEGQTLGGSDNAVLLLQATKRSVAAHKGVVSIESKKGEGMKIHCFIPVK